MRFSLSVNIGQAAFECDMRRLSEIIAFPGSWYRRSVARRLLFGEEKTDAEDGGGMDATGVSSRVTIHKQNYLKLGTEALNL